VASQDGTPILKGRMTIEWFPGHMNVARKEAATTMRQTDVVIEVLDARVPQASCNPMVETLRLENRRPALKLLNKQDAADPALTRLWLAHYNAMPGVKAVALSATQTGEVRRIPQECLALAPDRTTKAKPLRLMILGIPNVGKSTLMNTLLKRHVANVGDEPAITKMQMRHELSPTSWIVDTPGMLWPKLGQDVAIKLAISHSIGRTAYDEQDAAMHLAGYLLKEYPQLLTARYGRFPEGCDAQGVLLAIAALRSLLARGAVPDLNKASVALLNDFRSGALGRITLERPA